MQYNNLQSDASLLTESIKEKDDSIKKKDATLIVNEENIEKLKKENEKAVKSSIEAEQSRKNSNEFYNKKETEYENL